MKYIAIALAAVWVAAPGLALAATLTFGPVYPGTTVVAGTSVSFGITPDGFDGQPSYWVIDSFGGGANNSAIAGNAFFWTPNFSMVGSHSITITGTDQSGTTSSAVQTITVLASPSITVGAPMYATVGVPVDMPISSIGFYSPHYSASDAFSGSSLHSDSVFLDVLHWTPLPQDIGVHAISVKGVDSFGSATTTTVSIEVLPVGGVSASVTASSSTNTAPAGAAPAAPVLPTPTISPTPGAVGSTITGTLPPAAPAHTFSVYLGFGSRGSEVTALQRSLIRLGFLGADSATGYFGNLTRAAVAAYQKAHGISAVGYVGPATRAALNTGN